MKPLLSIFIACLFLLACKKNTSVEKSDDLNGRWIEATGRGDTLIFDSPNTLINVKRAIVNQPLRSGTGLWTYKLLGNYQMDVRYTVSSSSVGTVSHVEIKDGVLYVSNFYEAESSKLELRSFNFRP